MNKVSFETKTNQDNRMWKKHQKIMYQAVTQPETPSHKPLKPKKNQHKSYKKLLSSPHPQNTQTLKKLYLLVKWNNMRQLSQYNIGQNISSPTKEN